MNAWNNLPNAKLIDQVLADLRANPEAFASARNAAWDAAVDAALDAAWDAAVDAARDMARGAAWDAARSAAWDAARDMAWGAAWSAAWGAVLALIAYDDSAKYLGWSYEKLKVWGELSEHPAAVLLLPYIWTKEQLKELT